MIYIKKLKIINNYHVSLDIASNGVHESEVYIKPGDNINPLDVLSLLYRSEESIEFDLCEELEIKSLKSPEDIKNYITVLDGQLVAKGKIVAHKSSLGYENIIKSPYEGIVSLEIGDKPKLVIQSTPIEIKLRAMAKGKIVSVDIHNLIIETNVIRILPSFMVGKSLFAETCVIKNVEDINLAVKGKVVYIPGEITSELATKSKGAGAAGIIGISADHMVLDCADEFFTVVSLEGFGYIEQKIYDKIEQSDSYLVYIDLQKGEILFATPLSIEDLKEAYVKESVFNDTVQLYDERAYARIGKIKRIEEETYDIALDEEEQLSIDKNNIIGLLL